MKDFNFKFSLSKLVPFSLNKIYGLGFLRGSLLSIKLGVSFVNPIKLNLLDLRDFMFLNEYLNLNFLLEEELVKSIHQKIYQICRIRSRRGIRHLAGFPVRGQRTRTNARTQRRSIFRKKKILEISSFSKNKNKNKKK
jgi:small subunit ribosomal protein S13